MILLDEARSHEVMNQSLFLSIHSYFSYFYCRPMLGPHKSLLSLIPPSCMVAPNREIANTYISFNYSAMSNSVEVNAISEDVNMDEPRDRPLLLSPNISRGTSTHSDTLSIPYIDRMEAQSNDSSWFNQTKQEDFQLSYASHKEGIQSNQDKANGPNDLLPTHIKGDVYNINNLNQHHGLGASSILYSNSDPADLELWDSKFNPISLFGMIEKSADDVKNIIMSLNHMASFCYKLHSACISTTSRLIFTNQVVLESPK